MFHQEMLLKLILKLLNHFWIAYLGKGQNLAAGE